MISEEITEWFEFADDFDKRKTAVQQLNELKKTHYILQTHYQVISSSDWNIQYGGMSHILVEAVPKEKQNESI